MSDRLENFFNKASRKINLVKDVGGKVGGGPLEPVGKSFNIEKARIADLRLFGKNFATLLKRTPFKSWPSPMFNLWLVLARIARQDPDSLDQARGLATLRFREDADEPWQERRWKLKGARQGTNIFPF